MPGAAVAGLSIGTFKINARVSVRGRRGVPLPPTYFLSTLKLADQILAYEYLRKTIDSRINSQLPSSKVIGDLSSRSILER